MTTADPGRAGPELADRLALAVVHLMRRMRREDDALGLSSSQLSAINRLVSEGELPIGQLAEAEGVRPPTMSRMVRSLEASGLLVRSASDEDARVHRVRHTSAAIRLLERGRAARAEGLGGELAKLSDAERTTLARAIDLMERLSGST